MQLRIHSFGRWVRQLAAISLAVAAFLVSEVAINRVPMLNGLAALDLSFQDSLRPTPFLDPRLRMIVRKPETYAKLGLPPDSRTLPRPIYGRLLEALDRAGAKVALIDTMFVGSSRGDPQFRKSIQSLKLLKLTLATTCDPEASASQTPDGMSCNLDQIGAWPFAFNDRVAKGSVFSLQEQSQGVMGFIPLQHQKGTSEVVWAAPIISTVQFLGLPIQDLRYDANTDRLTDDSAEWQLSGAQLFNRGTIAAGAIPTVEFADALHLCETSGGSSRFKDCLVVIGADLPNEDRKAVGPLEDVSGSYLLAEAVNTALRPSSQQHREVPLAPTALSYSLLAGWGSTLLMWTRTGWKRTVGVIGGISLAAIVPFAICATTGYFFSATLPVLTTGLSLLGAAALRWIFAPRLEMPQALKEVDATVMFLDLVSSTLLLDSVGPFRFQELVTRLFQEFSPIVARNGGVIERSLGDGFIALFRVGGGRHHALRALDAAPVLVAKVREIGELLGVQVEANIGIETGPVFGNYIDENGHKVWSSSGRTVVIAQRIQSLCRTYDVNIALGPVARRYVASSVRCKVVATAHAKGFAEPVEISTPESH